MPGRTPCDHTPCDHTPSDHTPSDHTPSDHTPSDHTPSDHTPRDNHTSCNYHMPGDHHMPPTIHPLTYLGTCCSDHGKGIIAAFGKHYPDVPWLGCWPHVAWHFSHGRLLPKTHPMFDEIQRALQELHTSHTTGMWDVLVDCLGKQWGDQDPALRSLWNSVLVQPHNRWHLGISRTPGAVPSQQCQEVRTSARSPTISLPSDTRCRTAPRAYLTTTCPLSSHQLVVAELAQPSSDTPADHDEGQQLARAECLVATVDCKGWPSDGRKT